MKIHDITLRDIREGRTWRFLPPETPDEGDDGDWLELPMEQWGPIVEATEFSPTDQVVYSGITVYESGRVTAIVCLRAVEDLDYGGDFCVFEDGRWQQLGLEPNPNAEPGETFFANPLAIDPSFDAPDHDYRKYHRDGFRSHVSKLGGGG